MADLEPIRELRPTEEIEAPSTGEDLRTEMLVEQALKEGQMSFCMLRNLHMFPSQEIVRTCAELDAEVQVRNVTAQSATFVSAKDVMSLLTLAAFKDFEVEVKVSGPDAEKVWRGFLGLGHWTPLERETQS